MATIQQDDQQNPNQQGQQPTTGGAGGAGTGGNGQGGSSTVAAPVSNVQQNAAPQNSQGYTDVGAYLDANQSGSQQLGNQVSSNLTNNYNTTKSGIDTSANDLINQVNQGYTKGNDQLIQQVAKDPTAATGNADTLSQFQSQLNDTYTGPQNWADYGTQQGKVNEAQQNANLVNTPGGLNVLTSQVETPQASQGVNQLDTLLLGGSPRAVGQVQAAAKPYNDLGTYLDSQNQAANTAITGGQTAAQNASQNALNAFTGDNGTLTKLNQSINDLTAKDLSDAKTTQAAVSNMVQTGQFDANAAKALGVTQDQWNQLQSQAGNVNTSHFVSGTHPGFGSAWTQAQKLDFAPGLQQVDPTQAINANTVASPEQFAQMQAIQQLLGGKMPQGAAINPALASLAGTYNPQNLNSFNIGGAQTYADAAAKAQQQEALDRANGIADRQNAEHDASKGGGIGGFLKNIAPWVANAPLKLAQTTLKPLQSQINKVG